MLFDWPSETGESSIKFSMKINYLELIDIVDKYVTVTIIYFTSSLTNKQMQRTLRLRLLSSL
jgi:hypothetical protein